MPLLTPEDLTLFADIDPAKAAAMIEDAEATAASFAPCIDTLEPFSPEYAAAKAILRRVVLRWHDEGTGALERVDSGPFAASFDTRSPRRSMFTNAEVKQLQALCGTSDRRAFEIDLIPPRPVTAGPDTDAYWKESPPGSGLYRFRRTL